MSSDDRLDSTLRDEQQPHESVSGGSSNEPDLARRNSQEADDNVESLSLCDEFKSNDREGDADIGLSSLPLSSRLNDLFYRNKEDETLKSKIAVLESVTSNEDTFHATNKASLPNSAKASLTDLFAPPPSKVKRKEVATSTTSNSKTRPAELDSPGLRLWMTGNSTLEAAAAPLDNERYVVDNARRSLTTDTSISKVSQPLLETVDNNPRAIAEGDDTDPLAGASAVPFNYPVASLNSLNDSEKPVLFNAPIPEIPLAIPAPSRLPPPKLQTNERTTSVPKSRTRRGTSVSATVPQRPKIAHNRMVSWGAGVPTPLQQPSLETDSGSKTRRQRLVLNDVLQAGPFEHEAETHILRALEHHQTLRERSNTMTSSVWSITDNAAHDFTSSPQGSFSHDNDDYSDPGAPLEGDEVELVGLSSLDNKQGEGSSSGFPVQLPVETTQTRPLLPEKPPRPRKIPGLKRQISVEDQLQGLTSKMNALQNQEQRHADGRPREFATAAMRSPPAGIMGSGDQLARNAMKLLREENEDIHKSPVVQPQLSTWDEEHGDADEDESMAFDTGGQSNGNEQQAETKGARRAGMSRRSTIIGKVDREIKKELVLFNNFFQLKRKDAWVYVKNALFLLIIPSTITAAILYYAVSNPPSGYSSEEKIDSKGPSTSWWLLFFGVRQVVTLMLAIGTQALVIDFLALNTKIMIRTVGPIISLLIVQSKGWPFILFCWSIYDFGMLQGSGPFAAHWLYFQSNVGLFNENNPSGHVVDNYWNRALLGVIAGVSALTAVKRFMVGLFQGRQLFTQYGHQLAQLMDKMFMISQLASLAKEVEQAARANSITNWDVEGVRGLAFDFDDDASISRYSHGEKVMDPENRNPLTGSLTASETNKLHQLLDEWEEPAVLNSDQENVSISSVLNFRKALLFIQGRYPFSYSFGEMSTRAECVESAQDMYERLMLRTPDRETLPFETIALITLNSKGKVKPEMARELIKLLYVQIILAC
jgi:hypothetical protein